MKCVVQQVVRWAATLVVVVTVAASVSRNTRYKRLTNLQIRGTVAAMRKISSNVECGAACLSKSCDGFIMQGSGGGRTCTVFSTITTALPAAQTSSLYALYVSLEKVDYVNSLVPSSYNSLLNNKDTELTACPAGTAIGALILDNGDSRQTKANYAECRQLIYAPGFALQSVNTIVSTGLKGQMSSQAQQCETDAVMVGLTGYDDQLRTKNWQEPYFVTGQCQRLVDWKVDYGQCVNVTSTSFTTWTGQSYAAQSSTNWNRYFLCPNKFLVVELSRKWLMPDKKPQYYSVLCCSVIPAL